MKPFVVKAYAKLNLALDLVGRREDGYHLLRMVNQSVSLADRLTVLPSDMLLVGCDDVDLPDGSENIAYRAAEHFYEIVPEAPKIQIQIEKHIPHEAGLGGGSTDAAAVLQILNQISGKPFSEKALLALGEKIGADVPFCIRGGTALVEGIGEQIIPLNEMPDCKIVLCKPKIGVETKAAFEMSDRLPSLLACYSENVKQAVKEGDLIKLSASLGNFFEDILKLPEILKLKAAFLKMGALGAAMTGSGSAVFGIFDDAVLAQKCVDSLKKQYDETFLCEPVSVPIQIEL
jgi:4-diphosphocytidyl-2-C-methyl-D-erythritol kinase